MQVTRLRIYPVKSLGGVEVSSADVEPWGLAGDRRWGLFDADGESVTARDVHALLGLRAEPVGDSAVRFTAADGAELVIEQPETDERVPVGLSRQGRGTPASDDVNKWLLEQLGRPLRLVWQDDPTVRSISPDNGGMPGETLSFADAGPLLLASEASMRQLNSWIEADAELPDVPDIAPSDLSGEGQPTREPLSIVRFRPNVVIDGDLPFAEDGWSRVRIGDVEFRTTQRCDRCVMTTIDPLTLAGGKEPIRTLARHRRSDRKTWFGIRLAPLQTGTIAVGDPVVGS